VELLLSGPELELVKQYAESLGMTLEEAVTHAVKCETNKRYVLPKQQARVVPFQGLKSDGTGDANG
jgi:hypothetical protein